MNSHQPSDAPDPQIARRLETALEIARETAARLRGHFLRGPARIDIKRDGSVVTEADREAEAAICRALEAAFPDDARLGEEHGETPGTTDMRWVIDPIDGTESFVRGVPLFGTMIGLEAAGRPVAGVIAMPALDEIVWGGRGLGAWRSLGDQTTAAKVSGATRASDAMFCTTSTDYFRRGGHADAFGRLTSGLGKMRGWSDCYAYVLLATGRCDVVVEPEVHWWDVAAAIPIIEAAGGQFTDWHGRALACQPASAVSPTLFTTLASNTALHVAAAKLLTA